MYCLFNDFLSDRNRNSNLRKCLGCMVVSYCGRACQREGWKDHKGECKNFAKVKPNVPTDSVRLIARLILKLQVINRYIILLSNFQKKLLYNYREEVIWKLSM